jgi:plastocyanin
VINRDRAPHTLTASSDAFDSGELAQEQTFSFRAPAAGTYPYICDLHQYMTGTLTVAAAG